MIWKQNLLCDLSVNIGESMITQSEKVRFGDHIRTISMIILLLYVEAYIFILET